MEFDVSLVDSESNRLEFSEKRVLIILTAIIAAILISVQIAASEKDIAFRTAEEIEKEYIQRKLLEPGSSLEEYLAFAALNNPGLEAAFYRWKSELEKIHEVSSLPDPIFSYSYYIVNVETRVGPQNQRFSLKQTFPWFGTLGTKEDLAFEASNTTYQKYQSEKLKLFFKVKSAYYDYYYLGREIEITRANMELLNYWESVARAKYKAALKQHQDVIKAQVELSRLEDRLLTLEEMTVPVSARLNAALNLPDSASLPVPDSIEDRESRINVETVKSDIISSNPDLKAIAHMIDKEEAAVRLAGKASYPNFTIGVDYIETGEAINPFMDESGKDPWMINASVNLPIWFGKNKAIKNQSRARLEMARNDLRNTENNLLALAEKVIFEYQDAERKIALYRDGLIPKTEQLLNTTYTAYQAGEIDFLNVIDAQRQLLDFQLELELARINKAKKLAEMELLTGRDLK